MPEPAVQLQELGHSYGDTPVLSGVSFEVQPRELVAVLGPSGCGKTTLLRALAGLLTPTAGEVSVGGRTVLEHGRELVPCERRGVGLVFQDYALFPTLSVRDNVGFGVKGRDNALVNELLGMVDLQVLAHRRPAQLSGGQQQRVALARALATSPQLLLLDEPFANVDAALRDELGALLRRTMSHTGVAIVLVTHDQEAALTLADRVAVLLPGPDGGWLAQLDTPAEIYRSPVSWEVASLTGAAWCEPDGEGLMVGRPEDTRVLADATGAYEVVRSTFLGRCHRIELRGPHGRVLAEASDPWSPGQRVSIELRRPHRVPTASKA